MSPKHKLNQHSKFLVAYCISFVNFIVFQRNNLCKYERITLKLCNDYKVTSRKNNVAVNPKTGRFDNIEYDSAVIISSVSKAV